MKAVHALTAARAELDGSPPRTAESLMRDWSRDGYGRRTVGVFSGERLVGYAEVLPGSQLSAAIDQDFHHVGIPQFLAEKVIGVGGTGGATSFFMHTRVDSPVHHALLEAGWREAGRSWTVTLTLPPDRSVGSFPLGPEWSIDNATPQDYIDVWTLIGDAYVSGSRRHRQAYTRWAEDTVKSPGFEPWQLRVLRRRSDGSVWGTLFLSITGGVGTIDRMAVHSDLRGQTLGQALMADAVMTLREHGVFTQQATVDNWNGVEGLRRIGGFELTAAWALMIFDLDWSTDRGPQATGRPPCAGELAETVIGRSGVFVLPGTSVLGHLGEALSARGIRVVSADAALWKTSEAMFTDLAARLQFPRFYTDMSDLSAALTDIATGAGVDPGSQLVILVNNFDKFHADVRSAALSLADALAAASRTAAAEGRLVAAVLQTSDPDLRLASAGARVLSSAVTTQR